MAPPLRPTRTTLGFSLRSLFRLFVNQSFLVPGRYGLIALATLLLLPACTTPPGVTVKELREEQAKVEQALREKAQLALELADQKIKAIETTHAATMGRVQQMADANYEAQLANRSNPAQNNSTYIVDKNTALVAANSPVPVTATAMREAEARVAQAQAAPSTSEIDTIYRIKWEDAEKALVKETTAKAELQRITNEQTEKLRLKEREVETRYREGMEKATTMGEKLLRQLDEQTQKLYAQLVWIFGGAGVLAGLLAFWCFYRGHFRMGYYGLAAAAFFVVAAFLTVWLQQNQWVVWVFGTIGVCGLAAMLIVKQGWLARNSQLVSFAGKRAALVRYIEQDLKKKLQDFGLAANETLETLDLHEVEQLQDKLVAELKQQGKPIPDSLKD